MKATNKYIKENLKTRPFILSRSTFPGSGRYGSHWTGDNYARPEFLKYSIIGIFNSQMFGIPLVGADVCGFIEPVNLDLCKRWMQLGAFYPFFRNHKEMFWGSQEPYVDSELTAVSIHAIQARYSLFRYMYSRYFETSLYGGTFFKPLFYEFTADTKAYDYSDTSFMLGSAVKVTPLLDLSQNVSFEAYFPNADWYNVFTGHRDITYIAGQQIGFFIQLPCGLKPPVLNVHLRGGFVIPMGASAALNLTDAMKSHIKLMIAPFEKKATGVIYYDTDSVKTIEDKMYQDITVNYDEGSISILSSERKFTYEYKDDIVDVIWVGFWGFGVLGFWGFGALPVQPDRVALSVHHHPKDAGTKPGPVGRAGP